jgi:hypothetical protein
MGNILLLCRIEPDVLTFFEERTMSHFVRRAVVVAAVLAVAGSFAWAAAEDVNGTGKWSFERNGQKVETTLKLKLEGDKLTGTISGRQGAETAIEEASFKDNEVKFSVTRERNGQKTTTKYSGKLSGDTITGTSVTGENSREWKAERAK